MTGPTVAFFGGSFDPPHVGHVLACAYVLSTASVERVLVAPVSAHAFAKPLSSFEDRLGMTRLAFEPLLGVEVSGIEAELPSPNYTLSTLLELQRRQPSWQLRLMIGSDVFAQRDKWQHFDKIAELAPPLVLERAGASDAPAPQPQTSALLPEVSSSEIRERLRRGNLDDPRLAELIPRKVLAYINRRGLYRVARAAP